jgi:hypothetical protein
MRVRTAASFAVAAVALASAVAPASAAVRRPKPITGSYSLTLAPDPDATEAVGCEGKARQQGVNVDTRAIKVAGPGTLVVKVTGFSGDWDTAVASGSGSRVAEGGGTSTGDGAPATAAVETLKYKNKKAQTLNLIVCNFLGSPNATVSYTFTYS